MRRLIKWSPSGLVFFASILPWEFQGDYIDTLNKAQMQDVSRLISISPKSCRFPTCMRFHKFWWRYSKHISHMNKTKFCYVGRLRLSGSRLRITQVYVITQKTEFVLHPQPLAECVGKLNQDPTSPYSKQALSYWWVNVMYSKFQGALDRPWLRFNLTHWGRVTHICVS